MTNEEMEQARKNYNNILLEQKKLREVRNRMLELEKDPTVKEYCKLLNYVNTTSKLDIKNIINNSFNGILPETENDNQIYVYMGTYIERGTNWEYSTYRNLETLNDQFIPSSSCSKYEEEGKRVVIYLNNEMFLDTYEMHEEAFYRLRNKYLLSLLTESQENALQEVIWDGHRAKSKIK